MLGSQFYHETIRKVVVAFGTLFNGIQLVRKDNDGTIVQSMKVPLAYGPRQKFLVRLREDPDLTKQVAITLPRIGFEIQNLTYDPSRKLNRVQKFKKTKTGNNSKLDIQYMPVPYNLDFELYIMAKNSDDALQIVEQILPYFQPDYTQAEAPAREQRYTVTPDPTTADADDDFGFNEATSFFQDSKVRDNTTGDDKLTE